MGIFTYLGPVLVLPFSHNLVAVIAVLVFGRAVACAAHIWACFLIVPHLKGRHFLPFSELKPLLRFGAWLTVSNVVGPLMVAFDRFLIGAMVSVSAVAYYAVPSEVVLKLSLIPAALVGVLFPAFSTASRADRARLVFLYECGVKYTFIVLFSLAIVLIAFAPEGLRLWLGSDFALNSTPVARWLAAAIFINAIAQIPYAHIQSVGRADLTAKLHLIELPFYAGALFLMASRMGIRGVAIAWFGRAALDAVLLFFLSHRLLPENEIVVSKLPWMLATALMAFVVAASNEPFGFRMAFVLGTCVVAALIGWFRVLSPRERTGMQVLFQRVYVSKPINPAENG
jgi:O-antigen/teichoic acid export membrane protein